MKKKKFKMAKAKKQSRICKTKSDEAENSNWTGKS